MNPNFTLNLDEINPSWQQEIDAQKLNDFWKAYTENGGSLEGLHILNGVVQKPQTPNSNL